MTEQASATTGSRTATPGGGVRSSPRPRSRVLDEIARPSPPGDPARGRRDRDRHARDRRDPALAERPGDRDRRLVRDDRQGRRGGRGLLTAAERRRLDAARRVRRRLGLADGSFDVAVSSFVLQLVPNRFRALREVRRVLRPGGLVRLDQLARGSSGWPPDDDFDDALEDVGEEPREWTDGPDDLRDGAAASPRCGEPASRTCGAAPASSSTRSTSTAPSASCRSSTRRTSSRASAIGGRLRRGAPTAARAAPARALALPTDGHRPRHAPLTPTGPRRAARGRPPRCGPPSDAPSPSASHPRPRRPRPRRPPRLLALGHHRLGLELDARRLDLGDDSSASVSSVTSPGIARSDTLMTASKSTSDSIEYSIDCGRWSGSALIRTGSIWCRSVPFRFSTARRGAGRDERDVDGQLLGHPDEEQVDMERPAVHRVDLDRRGRGPGGPSCRRPTGRSGRSGRPCGGAGRTRGRRARRSPSDRRGRRRRPAGGRRGGGWRPSCRSARAAPRRESDGWTWRWTSGRDLGLFGSIVARARLADGAVGAPGTATPYHAAGRKPARGPRAPSARRQRSTSGASQPFSSAIRAASARFRAPIFWMAAERWLRTVPSDRDRRAAISAIVADLGRGREDLALAIDSGFVPSVRASSASAGSTTRPPAATRRIASASSRRRRVLQEEAGRAGLHRPAEVARPPERRHDDDPAGRQRRSGAGPPRDSPSRPGISMSSRATSGRALERRGTTSSPRATSATTSRSRSSAEQRHDRAADERLVLGERGRRIMRSAVSGDGTCEPEPAVAAAGARLDARRRPSATRSRRPGEAGAGCRRRAPRSSPRRRPRRRSTRVVRGSRPRRPSVVPDAGSRAGPAGAVAEDVRDALADRPAEDRVGGRRQRLPARARPRPSIPAAASAERGAGQLGRRGSAGGSRRSSRGPPRATRGRPAGRRPSRPGPGRIVRQRAAPASSLFRAMTERLWPSVSWRSRAIRARSSATASRASSWRAATSGPVRPPDGDRAEDGEADDRDRQALDDRARRDRRRPP